MAMSNCCVDGDQAAFLHAEILGAGEDVGFEVVHTLAHPAGAESELAARAEHHQRLAAHDRFEWKVAAGEIESEGLADADHFVEPRFRCRRHAMIVQRCSDDDDVGATKLADQFVGEVKFVVLVIPSFFRRREGRGDPGLGDEGRRVATDIARDDVGARFALQPMIDESLGKLPAERAFAARAGVDMSAAPFGERCG